MNLIAIRTATGKAITITPHPDAGGILAQFPVGTVVEFGDGQAFIVGHRGPIGIVMVPITSAEAERICSSDGPTTTASPVN